MRFAGSALAAATESDTLRTSARPAPARLGYVDGLRALAALCVLVVHVADTALPAASPNEIQVRVEVGMGHAAVSVFIVLSGFSLMLPVARNASRLPWSVWGFYWRRARRILPPYYLALSFSLSLIWLWIGKPTMRLWDNALPVTGWAILTHLLLVHDFSAVTNQSINPVFWSIAVECQIYLLFPALVRFWRRYQPLFCVLIVVALSFTLTTALAPTWIGRIPGYGLYAVAPQYIGLFALGMFAASVYDMRSPHWDRLRAWSVWGALGGFLCVAGGLARISPILLDIPTGFGMIAVLIAASRPGINPVRAVLEWRPLVWIGGFSYSLYLIHAPLIQVLWQYAFHPLGLSDTATYLLLLVVGGPLIVVAAWGFWWACERPFLNSRVSGARERRTREGLPSAAV